MPRPVCFPLPPAGVAALALAILAGRLAADDVRFTFTDSRQAAVPDVVVSLTPAAPSPGADAAMKRATAEHRTIVQRGKEFIPFVTAVAAGTAVELPNDDKVEHQVYSLSEPRKFELPLYKPGKSGTVVFDRAGIVTLGCNIHDWMLAYVVVLDTPWFAQADATGVATVTGVSPGSYVLVVWHPRLAKPIRRNIEVGAGPLPSTATALVLELKPERRIRRAPEATGGRY